MITTLLITLGLVFFVVMTLIVFLGLCLMSLRSRMAARTVTSLMAWLASPWLFLATACAQIAQGCRRCARVDLPVSSQPEGGFEEEPPTIIESVGLLFNLAAGALLILGDFPLTLLRLGAFFGIHENRIVNLSLSVATGFLWMIVPYFFFAAALEMANRMPQGLRLFPPFPPLARDCLGLIFGALFIVAALVGAGLFLWGEVHIEQLTLPIEFKPYLAAVFGFLVYLAAGIAGLAIILGLCICCIVAWLFSFLHFLCRVVGTMIAGFGQADRD